MTAYQPSTPYFLFLPEKVESSAWLWWLMEVNVFRWTAVWISLAPSSRNGRTGKITGYMMLSSNTSEEYLVFFVPVNSPDYHLSPLFLKVITGHKFLLHETYFSVMFNMLCLSCLYTCFKMCVTNHHTAGVLLVSTNLDVGDRMRAG